MRNSSTNYHISTSSLSRDDPHWMTIEHPNGWHYYYHPIYHVIVDDTSEPFQIPTVDKDQDEETHKDKESSIVYFIHHRQRSVSCPSLEQPRVYRARQSYWEYISKYPAHHPLSARQIIFRARKEATLFLQWCSVGKCISRSCIQFDNAVSSEALIPSSSPTAPFSLEVSQNLYDLLSKMDETPSVDAAQDSSSIMTIAMVLEKKCM